MSELGKCKGRIEFERHPGNDSRDWAVVRAGWGVKEDKLKVATCNSGKFWRSQNKSQDEKTLSF